MLTKTKIILTAALLMAATSAVTSPVRANEIDQSASPSQVERDWRDYLNHTYDRGGVIFNASPNESETSGSHKQQGHNR